MTVIEEYVDVYRDYGSLSAAMYNDAEKVVAQVQAAQREAGEEAWESERISDALADSTERSRGRSLE